ncbi:MAG TPA: DNA-3-methyladenine glycosylase [Bacillales bacterium]|nr:DNA-3-methyladenine glycosylase [Bacillales bacterium]
MNADFFTLPTLELAKRLLGSELIHETNNGQLSGKIVETEAYLGPEDRAAHSYGGRRTKRTEVMFDRPGLAYLYFIYGMHVCLNVVSGPFGKPEAILIRAIEPTVGMDKMCENRGFSAYELLSEAKRRQLTNGPGKLVQALGISLDFYGHDLQKPPLYIQPASHALPQSEVAIGPRIGIENTGEAKHYPYRFSIKDHPYVSK